VRVGRIGTAEIMIDRGVAEADLRIIVSSVSPHLQAGFGGGYKMLLPGCAHLETIRFLHHHGITRGHRQLVGTDPLANPMRRVIDAGGALVDEFHGKTFTVQYLLDDHERPGVIAAGEPKPTHQMMAKHCAISYGVLVSETADVLIANAYPRDFDLWQTFKAIPNTCWSVRPNGPIICLGRCSAGSHGVKPIPWPLNATWTRRLIRLIGADNLSNMLTKLVPRLAGDAAFFVRLATQTLHRNPIFLVAPGLVDEGMKFPGVHLFREAEDAVRVASDMLGSSPQRVIVYPQAGISYPVRTQPKAD
jgi:hypothetical protein